MCVPHYPYPMNCCMAGSFKESSPYNVMMLKIHCHAGKSGAKNDLEKSKFLQGGLYIL